MDIDALRQAHEKLKRQSQRQRDRIKELEGLRGNIKSTNIFITEILDNYEQYSKFGKPACDILNIINDLLSQDTTQPEDECYCDGLELEGLAVCKYCGRTALTQPDKGGE